MATRKTNPEPEANVQEIPEEKETAKAVDPKDAEIAKLKAELEAARKPASRETDYDRVHRIERETAESGADPWNVYVDVLVPHREKTEDPWYWINVNGFSVQIPARDRYEKLKLPWACVLVDTLKSEKASIEYQDQLEVYDPETNPHRN